MRCDLAIEEMPHDDVAGFCLAVPWMKLRVGCFPVSFPARLGSGRSLGSDLDLRREGPMPAYVPVADDQLHHRGFC
jgi:hypothetical protein